MCFLLYYAYAAYFWDGEDISRCISAGLCVIIFQYFIILYFFTFDFCYLSVHILCYFMSSLCFAYKMRKCYFCFYIIVGL